MQVDREREIYIYIHIEWSGQASGTCKCVSIVAIWSPFFLDHATSFPGERTVDSLWPVRATQRRERCNQSAGEFEVGRAGRAGRGGRAGRAVAGLIAVCSLPSAVRSLSPQQSVDRWLRSGEGRTLGVPNSNKPQSDKSFHREKLNDSRVQGSFGLQLPTKAIFKLASPLRASSSLWCTLVAGFPKGLSENMVPLNPLVYHHCSIKIAMVRHT